MSSRTLSAALRTGVCTAACAAFLAPIPVTGQVDFMTQPDGGSVALDLHHPFYAEEGISTLTGTLRVSVRYPLADGWRAALAMPFARYDETGDDLGASSGPGNPYVGIEKLFQEGRSAIDVGVRLPVAPTDRQAVIAARVSDFEHLERFTPDYMSVQAVGRYRSRPEEDGDFVSLRGGPVLMIHTGDEDLADDSDERRFGMVYAGGFGWESRKGWLLAELSGRFITDSDAEGFGDRSWHSVTGGGGLRLGRISPHFRLRLPLDEEVEELYGLALSLGAAVSF